MSERQPTCTFTRTIHVRIRGEKDGSDPYRIRKDGGLVGRFLAWCSEQRIATAESGGVCGGGEYSGNFSAANAARIATWLVEQGASEVPT